MRILLFSLLACTEPPVEEPPAPGVDPGIPAAPGEARAGIVRAGAAGEVALFGGVTAEGRAGDIKLYNSRVQVVIQEESGRDRLGAVTALAMLSRSMGSGLGVAATGAVLYSLLPDVSIQELISGSGGFDREDVLQAFHAQFLFLAAIAGLATLVSSRIPRIRI